MKNGSFNLPDSNVPKGPTHIETYQHYSKILKLGLATGKHQKSAKKSAKSKINIKIVEQPLQHWEMGLPIYQIKMHQKAPPITKHTDTT